MFYITYQKYCKTQMYNQAAYKNNTKKFCHNKMCKAENYRFSESRLKLAHLNKLIPSEIISTEWTNWNNPDVIIYKSTFGGFYIVQDENLLADINEYMRINVIFSTLPYIHTEGKETWECYSRPENKHILEYLRTYLNFYDIYTQDGELVREAYNFITKHNKIKTVTW